MTALPRHTCLKIQASGGRDRGTEQRGIEWVGKAEGGKGPQHVSKVYANH